MNVEQYANQLVTWHKQYSILLACYTLANRAELEATKLPSITFKLRKGNISGQYHPLYHVCRYSIPYAVLGSDRYEETVAHECSHAFQRQAFNGHVRNKWHSKQFYLLLRGVCGFTCAGRCHSWSSRKAKALHDALRSANLLLAAERCIPAKWTKPQNFTRSMYGELVTSRGIAACKSQDSNR